MILAWLKAKPWTWNLRTVYRSLRQGSRHPTEDRWVVGGEPQGRIRALWGALSFPHTHEDDEYEYEYAYEHESHPEKGPQR